jgi:hypothetical protein
LVSAAENIFAHARTLAAGKGQTIYTHNGDSSITVASAIYPGAIGCGGDSIQFILDFRVYLIPG